MGDTSKIEWTDATWNPVTGCTKVSPGCDHCYAEGIANRFRGPAFPNGFDVTIRENRLREPLRWKEPRRVFVNSMSDLFHEAIPDDYIARVFAVMAATQQHTYQILTKRHGRMRSLLASARWPELLCEAPEWPSAFRDGEPYGFDLDPERPLDNVWLGVSVEDQKWADIRIPALLGTPAAVHFLSCEPLLGPIDLTYVAQRVPRGGGPAKRFALSSPCVVCHGWGGPPSCPDDYHFVSRGGIEPCIDWVIVGGESGAGTRAMEPEWPRLLRDQCVAAGVPFFFKQWGSHDEHGKRMSKHAAGRLLDGRTWDEYPQAVTV